MEPATQSIEIAAPVDQVNAAWDDIVGRRDATVEIDRVGPGRTRVTLSRDVSPQLLRKALEQFKQQVEAREAAAPGISQAELALGAGPQRGRAAPGADMGISADNHKPPTERRGD